MSADGGAPAAATPGSTAVIPTQLDLSTVPILGWKFGYVSKFLVAKATIDDMEPEVRTRISTAFKWVAGSVAAKMNVAKVAAKLDRDNAFAEYVFECLGHVILAQYTTAVCDGNVDNQLALRQAATDRGQALPSAESVRITEAEAAEARREAKRRADEMDGEEEEDVEGTTRRAKGKGLRTMKQIDEKAIFAKLGLVLDPEMKNADGNYQYNKTALLDALQRPWEEEARIPVTSETFGSLKAKASGALEVVRELKDDEVENPKLTSMIMSLIYHSDYECEFDSEDMYHGGYDQLFTTVFGQIMKAVTDEYLVTRNRAEPAFNKERSPVGTQRPDGIVVHNKMLTYKWEEKKGEGKNPRQELVEKMGPWTVVARGSTDFLLCHAAEGWFVEFSALKKITGGVNPSCFREQLGPRYNVQLLESRFMVLRMAVNALRIGVWQSDEQGGARHLTVPVVGEVLRARCRLKRNLDGVRKWVKICSQTVNSDSDSDDVADDEPGGFDKARVERLHRIVLSLQGTPIPQCPRIANVKISSTRLRYDIRPLMFPVGDRLRDWTDVREAVQSALAALCDFHARGFRHNDIRWSNLLKAPGPPEAWKLCDFDYASEGDGPYLCHWVHSPDRNVFDTFGTNASTKSDLYMVGRLISSADIGDVNPPETLRAFGERLISQEFESSVDALAALEV